MVLRGFMLSLFLAGTLGQNATTGPQESATFSAQPASRKAAILTKNVTGRFATVAALAGDKDASHNIVMNANDFVDGILKEVRTSKSIQAKIHPIIMGEVNYEGFTLSDARLYGLHSLYRSDNCDFVIGPTYLDILVHLGAKHLILEADWSKTFLFIPLSGDLTAKLKHISIAMDLTIDKDGVPSLRGLKVVHLTDIHITKATGASFLFNWALRGIFNMMLLANKENIIQLLENQGAVAINAAMKHLPSTFKLANFL